MAGISLLQHYLEYIFSPPVLLTILIIVGPFILEIHKNKVFGSLKPPTKIPWCFRLGLYKRSNLHGQYNSSPTESGEASKPRIKALFTYPIKSCRGVELSASEVVATGLKYDRLFTFAQLVSKPDKAKNGSKESNANEVSAEWKHEWRFMTQRDFPRLALLQTELHVPDPRAVEKTKKAAGSTKEKATYSTSWAANGGCLIFRFPFEPDFNPFGLRTEEISIRLPLAPSSKRASEKKYDYETVSIWKDHTTSINMTNEIPEQALSKLKYFLGVSNPLALFRVDDRNRRAVTRNLPKKRPGEAYFVGFADAFPLHILNIASVRAVHGDLPEKTQTKMLLDARRFRANIYVTGPEAYEEDSWKKVLIGRCIRPGVESLLECDGEYHVACRTARCKLPNVTPDTGILDRNEPSTTLGRTRKVDKGAYPHPCLGMQMIPLFEQGLVRVGDEIAVVERGDHVYEKMFA